MALWNDELWGARLWREADALRRQSTLLHRGLRPQRVQLASHATDVDVVFLLHGVFATAGVFGPIIDRLRQSGIDHIASFTYRPFRTMTWVARELARACGEIPPHARLHLIGHSLGGVAARYYVQSLGGAGRVAQTLSLASPFHGTTVARYIPTEMAREVAPGSPLLAELCAPLPPGQRDVPHLSVVASDDMIIQPPMSAAFPRGEVVVLDNVGHNGLLFDPRVADLVAERITVRARAA